MTHLNLVKTKASGAVAAHGEGGGQIAIAYREWSRAARPIKGDGEGDEECEAGTE